MQSTNFSTPGKRTASFHTLGCKLNQSETDSIRYQFQLQGYHVVPFRSPADYTIINTCAVTSEADAKSRQIIRQARVASPHGCVIAVGCYAQIDPQAVAALAEVDMVLGTNEKHHILTYLERYGRRSGNPIIEVDGLNGTDVFDDTPFLSATTRTRALLKVQEGCDYNCSYCVIPFARGKGRSRSLENSLSEAARLAAGGYSELVVTGINVGTWSDGDANLVDLLNGLSRVAGLQRIRISSIEPNLITDELLELIAERDNLCPHLHVPLQHASDKILKAMRRRYRFADYAEIIERIRHYLPDAGIGGDVIVGFPGETEQDFELLARALVDLPLSYYHIFRYSERPGTWADKYRDAVDPGERKRRGAVLRDISRSKQLQFARQYLTTEMDVLFEDQRGAVCEGLTDNYVRVRVNGGVSVLAGSISPVMLEAVAADGVLLGTLQA